MSDKRLVADWAATQWPLPIRSCLSCHSRLPVSRNGSVRMKDDQRFSKGLEIRREVLGNEYVDNNLAGSDEFMMTFQHIVTELAWGYAWNGTALNKKTKSMLSIAILAASGRFEELEIYTRGALRTGVTLDELKEI